MNIINMVSNKCQQHTSVISFVFEQRETVAPNNVHPCVPGKLLSLSLKQMCLSVCGGGRETDGLRTEANRTGVR